MTSSLYRRFPLALAAVLAWRAAGALAGSAPARLPVKFTLDWKFQGPTSAFLLAAERGYYAAEGLAVTIDAGSGSGAALQRVAGGAYQLGLADINSVIEFDANNPARAISGVFMVYDAPPFSVFTLKRTGISGPKLLEGRSLGAPVFDASYRLFPVFARKAGIDESKVVRRNMDPPLREAMLVRGEVDAVSGHYFTCLLDLKARGAAESEIVSFRYSDYGLALYGNAVIASPAMAREHSKELAGFVRATLKGFRDALADPAAGVAAVKRRDPLIDEALELERLRLAIRDNILTPAVRAKGMGDVDPKRLKSSIAEVAQAFGLARSPSAEQVFTSRFLPPRSERRLAR